MPKYLKREWRNGRWQYWYKAPASKSGVKYPVQSKSIGTLHDMSTGEKHDLRIRGYQANTRNIADLQRSARNYREKGSVEAQNADWANSRAKKARSRGEYNIADRSTNMARTDNAQSKNFYKRAEKIDSKIEDQKRQTQSALAAEQRQKEKSIPGRINKAVKRASRVSKEQIESAKKATGKALTNIGKKPVKYPDSRGYESTSASIKRHQKLAKAYHDSAVKNQNDANYHNKVYESHKNQHTEFANKHHKLADDKSSSAKRLREASNYTTREVENLKRQQQSALGAEQRRYEQSVPGRIDNTKKKVKRKKKQYQGYVNTAKTYAKTAKEYAKLANELYKAYNG